MSFILPNQMFRIFKSVNSNITSKLRQFKKTYSKQTNKPNKTKLQFSRLLEVIKPDYKLISIGLVALAFSTGITLIVPYKIGQLVDLLNLPPEESKKQISNLSFLLAGLFTLSSIFSFGRFYTISVAGQKVSARLRKQLFTSIMKQESSFFDKNKSGELNTRLNTDIQIVSETLTSTVVSGLRSSVEGFLKFVVFF